MLEITALPDTGFFLALKCPSSSSYSPCANPCPATCLSLTAPRDCPAALPCTEGCECQKGHVLSGTSCVPLSQCGCGDQEGYYHPVRGRTAAPHVWGAGGLRACEGVRRRGQCWGLSSKPRSPKAEKVWGWRQAAKGSEPEGAPGVEGSVRLWLPNPMGSADAHIPQVGERWYADHTCSRLCTCSARNAISCQQAACKPGQRCWPLDGLLRCRASGRRPLSTQEDPGVTETAVPQLLLTLSHHL